MDAVVAVSMVLDAIYYLWPSVSRMVTRAAETIALR